MNSTAKVYEIDKSEKRKRYDQSFKEEAVQLAKEIGRARTAKVLNISINTLHNWCTLDKNKKNAPATQETVETGKVLAENYELKKENEILKAALGYFIKEEQLK